VRQLEHLFSAQLRSTVNARYKRIRLGRAGTLLAQTALPILEIALICGFRTASHFSRNYRNAYGVSPRNGRSPRTP
jgi:AraC family transcriptional regulator, glycine betaine-responsive activator